jgi:hypothetical protein
MSALDHRLQAVGKTVVQDSGVNAAPPSVSLTKSTVTLVLPLVLVGATVILNVSLRVSPASVIL